MDLDAFFEEEYENLNNAILQAIVSSKEVQEILGRLKKKEGFDQMAVLNLFFSIDELYEIIYKLEPAGPKQLQEERRADKKISSPVNKVSKIDGKALTLNESLFENFFQEKFNEKAWLKKARIRL